MSKASLDERIADAFANPLPAVDLSDLLDQTKVEASRVAAAQVETERTALNPATRPSAVDEARKELSGLSFRASRLANAVDALTKLLDETAAREATQRHEQVFSEARRHRDEVVKRIETEFPDLAEKLLSLVQDIVKSNIEVAAANERRGEGVPPIDKAEAVVTGLQRGGAGRYPGRIVEMMIPNLVDPYHPTWPPRWRADDERPLEADIDRTVGAQTAKSE